MGLERRKPVKIFNDGNNEIIFKPNTRKVIIGMNIHSWYKATYRSFTCSNEDEAMKIGMEYIKQHNKWENKK